MNNGTRYRGASRDDVEALICLVNREAVRDPLGTHAAAQAALAIAASLGILRADHHNEWIDPLLEAACYGYDEAVKRHCSLGKGGEA